MIWLQQGDCPERPSKNGVSFNPADTQQAESEGEE